MIILGLHYGMHDTSACVVKNGKLIAAINAERLSGKKKDARMSDQVINYLLDVAEIDFDQIDLLAIAEYYIQFDDINLFITKDENSEERLMSVVRQEDTIGNDHLELSAVLRGKRFKMITIPHHLAHCASTFYTSNFEKSWCLSMDTNYGLAKHNSLIAFGDGNKLWAQGSPGIMIGVGYAMFTELLGIGPPVHKAGSTMGLASYGKPFRDLVERRNDYVKDCFFDPEEGMRYLQFLYSLWHWWTNRAGPLDKADKYAAVGLNTAASIQYLFEECILELVNNIKDEGTLDICLAGGSFLNCNANSVVRIRSKFKNVHHFPAVGDDGLCVGAALYVAHHLYDEPRATYKTEELCYLGRKYQYQEPDYKFIANEIANGKIVAWFMGGSEYGPRALGNRSILADPRDFHMREKINFIVKDREWFRPFAPAVLEEDYAEWFDFPCASPYMLYTAQSLKPKEVPAITHIDGSARFQTVNSDTNEPFYKLIKEFKEITGVPMVLNTSLNGDGEPILETERDAFKWFNKSKIDYLVLNGVIYKKELGRFE
jgi:carbamoyltransferase